MLRLTLAMFVLVITANVAFAGTGYQVTSKDGDKETTYMVKFGGGRAFQQHTAYDPESKEFVYLTWRRGEEAPKPVSKIWNHQTGETVDLYKFPGAKHPLPVIPSIKDMKVCPRTGDRNFKSQAVLAYD